MEFAIFIILAMCAAVRSETDCTGFADTGTQIDVPSDQKLIVDQHNRHRTDQSATNEIKMQWNDTLARMAQLRADRCEWSHGDTKSCDGDYLMGQNMYMSMGSSAPPGLNIVGAIKAWYDEIADWNFDTNSCNPGAVCGHYTQLVWHSSEAVGCGVSQCATAKGSNGAVYSNAVIFVCNYFPQGNWVGEEPLHKGVPCANCDTVIHNKGYSCHDYLCERCVPAEVDNCICLFDTCENGGVFDADQCSCNCPAGYVGNRCESSCNPTCIDNGCAVPAWLGFCENPMYEAFMTEKCKGSCPNLCKKPAGCPVE